LKLAAELSTSFRAVGFGVHHWLEEDEQNWLEQLWQDC
jgi:O-succinylbenzoate synthase